MNHRRLLYALAALALLSPLALLADGHGKGHGRGHERDRGDEVEEDDDEDGGHGQGSSRSRVNASALRATPQWKAYAAECGSCHLAYPPSLLPARSWRALSAGLADHFGQSAEVDAKALAPIEAFLVANAGKDPGGAVPLRITGLSWWQREHRKVEPAVFARKAVATKANCAACHPGAKEGAFSEKTVKIPRDAPPAR